MMHCDHVHLTISTSLFQSIVRDFKISMALDEISRLENIQVPAYQIEEQLQQLKDQANQAGQADEFDDEQVRKKVESTLERRMVFDFLAEHADLEVEYMKEGEDQFDEALMEKLAQESLEREQTSTSEGEHDNVNPDEVVAAAEVPAAVEEEPVVETVVEEVEPVVVEAKVEEIEPVVENKIDEKNVAEDVEVTKEEKKQSFKYDDAEFKGMDQGEKAFNILVDLGMVELNPDPNAPDFDASAYADEEED